METKGLLKNADKFNNIKLANGRDLTNSIVKKRKVKSHDDIGVSTQSYGHLWFVIQKGKGLFKTYDDFYAKNVRNIRIINELLCKKLCDQIGIDCAEYEQASIKDDNGVLTYDIFGDKKPVNICDFIKIVNNPNLNLLDCEKAIDLYCKEGYKLDKKEIMTSLYKYILFDTLTIQTDRNIHNLVFLFDKKNDTFTISKLFDNEFAFFTEGILNYIKTNNKREVSLDEIISKHSFDSKIFSIVNGYTANAQRFYNNIFYLVLYAYKHESLLEILNFSLENFNPEKAFNELEKEGNKISPEYKQYVCNLTEGVKQKIINEKHSFQDKTLLDETEKLY